MFHRCEGGFLGDKADRHANVSYIVTDRSSHVSDGACLRDNARQVLRELDLRGGEVIVDIGAGEGWWVSRLAEQVAEPLRMGIGIHAGPAIVGEMGYHKAVILTAVGDAVNTTSRVQEATKEFACQLIVSRLAAEKSGVDFSAFPPEEMEVRGRTQALAVYPVATAGGLPEIPQE